MFLSYEFFNEEKFGFYNYFMKYWGFYVVGLLGGIGVCKVDGGFFKKLVDSIFVMEEFDDGFMEIKEIVFVFMVMFLLENVFYYLLYEVMKELIKIN